jgi:hypothetical protein
MPIISERSYLLSQFDFILRIMVMNGEEDSADFREIIDLRFGLLSTRYLNSRNLIPKNRELNRMLWYFPEREFRQIVRMDKQSFVRLLFKIQNHTVFQTRTNNKQEPVWIQLMVVLQRLGCDGNGASIGRNARIAGVSYGSVCKFTSRVFTSLLAIKNEVIKWPDENERKEISRRFARNHGLPGAVGVVDGTPVNFSQRPHIDGEVYWTRKSRYAMNVQLICDDRRRITYYQIGWPGSVYDSTVFGESTVFKQANTFFFKQANTL